MKYSLKLYDDLVRICAYEPIKPRIKYYDEYHKIHLETGNLYKWGYLDTLSRVKMYKQCVRRSVQKIEEIAELTHFSYFLTVTFPRSVVNATDAAAVKQIWKRLVKRLRFRFGGFEYLEVSEFHSDEKSIHIHALVNFGRTPKLKYRGRSEKSGEQIFHIHESEKFKRSDVFLTLEKIAGAAPVHYLTKYLTKGHVSPFTRRYTCSRNVVHRRLRDVIQFDAFPEFSDFAKENGFACYARSRRLDAYVVTQRGAAALDLSKYDIKGEKKELSPEELADWFYTIVQKARHALLVKQKVLHIAAQNATPRPHAYMQDHFFRICEQ